MWRCKIWTPAVTQQLSDCPVAAVCTEREAALRMGFKQLSWVDSAWEQRGLCEYPKLQADFYWALKTCTVTAPFLCTHCIFFFFFALLCVVVRRTNLIFICVSTYIIMRWKILLRAVDELTALSPGRLLLAASQARGRLQACTVSDPPHLLVGQMPDAKNAPQIKLWKEP